MISLQNNRSLRRRGKWWRIGGFALLLFVAWCAGREDEKLEHEPVKMTQKAEEGTAANAPSGKLENEPEETTQKAEERTAANTTAPSEKPVNDAEKSTQKGKEDTAANTTAPVPTPNQASPQLGSEKSVTGSDKQPVAKNYRITIKMAADNIQHNFAGEGDVIKAPITGEVFVSTEEDSVSMKPVGKDAFGNQVFEGMWLNKKTNEGFHLGRMTKEDVSRGACWRNNEANVCAFPR